MSPRKQPTTQEETALAQAGLDPDEIKATATQPSPARRRFEKYEHDTRPIARHAVGYVHAKHPDTGLDVVFVPGERLPAWASEGD